MVSTTYHSAVRQRRNSAGLNEGRGVVSAVVLVCFTVILGCDDAKEREMKPTNGVCESLEMYGLVTKFEVAPVRIKNRDNFTISMEMKNVSSGLVRFRYSTCIEEHLELRDAHGNVVAWKDGAPLPECPRFELDIKAGETLNRKAQFKFGKFYAVAPGTYSLHFKYDKRLMEKPPLKDPWVPWSKNPIKIAVLE